MRYLIQDPAYGNIPVGAFEVPEGWQANSQVNWNMQNTSNPAWVYARTYNPAGLEALEYMPTEPCYWLHPNMACTRLEG